MDRNCHWHWAGSRVRVCHIDVEWLFSFGCPPVWNSSGKKWTMRLSSWMDRSGAIDMKPLGNPMTAVLRYVFDWFALLFGLPISTPTKDNYRVELVWVAIIVSGADDRWARPGPDVRPTDDDWWSMSVLCLCCDVSSLFRWMSRLMSLSLVVHGLVAEIHGFTLEPTQDTGSEFRDTS